MPSDRRFHPLTVLFALAGVLRNFLMPIVVATFTARSRGGDVEDWLVIFMIPAFAMAAARYWVSTYRYDDTELVVRTGILFRNERHVPYARIQTVDAKQNVFHRLFGVVEVQVRTGTGGEAEATLSVLPLSALEQMRQRVSEGKRVAAASGDGEGGAEAGVPLPKEPGIVTLSLSVGDTALSGLLDNRAWVVISAASGLLWETGVFEGLEEWLPQTSWTVVAAVAAGLFIVSPMISVLWAMVRLYGFRLIRRGGELLTEYGALTRVTGTVPLRRIQAVKIVQTPGHQLTGRAAVRVETAGGTAAEGRRVSEREWVAPIIRSEAVPAFVSTLLPGVDLDHLDWQRPDVAAGVRRMRLAAIWSLVIGLASLRWIEWVWAVPASALFVALALLAARQYVRSLGWVRTDDYVCFRSGWLWKTIAIVPVAKVQAVELQESPFDRRWAMASVSVDTAGAGPHRIDVPYLSRDVAERLRTTLLAHTAATEYQW